MAAMLSTIDNPYNPFKEFDMWYAFDLEKGYNCCSYVSRIALIAEDLPENLAEIEMERAIDEIVEVNINGMYCKVTD